MMRNEISLPPAGPRRIPRRRARRTHLLAWVSVGVYSVFMLFADELLPVDEPAPVVTGEI